MIPAQITQNFDKLLDWQGALTAVFVVVIAGIRTLYHYWFKKQQEEKIQQPVKTKDEELLVDSYQELILMLRDEVRRLREDVETLSELRVENIKLRHKIMQLENKNREQAEELALLRARFDRSIAPGVK